MKILTRRPLASEQIRLLRRIEVENAETPLDNNEEIKSSFGYPVAHREVRDISSQVARLRRLIPGIGYADEKIAEGKLPKNAEGWFAIPKWQSIAPSYALAVQKILGLIKETRSSKFRNYRKKQITNKYLRQTTRTKKMLNYFIEAQEGYGILVIPAQFGILHAGRSVRRALEMMDEETEFGLGAYEVGIMLLTHPERLNENNTLFIDCGGDVFSDPGSFCTFDRVPCFAFTGKKIKFGTSKFDAEGDGFGLATGFIPQH